MLSIFFSQSLAGGNPLLFLCDLQAKALLDFFAEMSFKDVCLVSNPGRQRYSFSLEQSSALSALHHGLSLSKLL